MPCELKLRIHEKFSSAWCVACFACGPQGTRVVLLIVDNVKFNTGTLQWWDGTGAASCPFYREWRENHTTYISTSTKKSKSRIARLDYEGTIDRNRESIMQSTDMPCLHFILSLEHTEMIAS